MLIRCLPARPRRWLILLALLAALPLPSGAAARPSQQFYGCGMPTGDAWFVDELAFAPGTIAPGALVEPLGNGVRLSNSTETPLYLVEELGDPALYADAALYAPAAPINLPVPLGVRHRVIAGEVATWYSADGDSPPQWNTARGISSLDYGANMLELWLPGFKHDLHYADDRPANVALPPAATYTLRVIYGKKLFEIPVTQTYRLNPNYTPDRERSARAACAERSSNLERFIMMAIVCIAILIVAGIGLVVYVIRRIADRYPPAGVA